MSDVIAGPASRAAPSGNTVPIGALKQSLDDKTYRPVLETFRGGK